MLGCRAMHPPAGIDAFLIAGLGLPRSWIVNPIMIGAVLLAGCFAGLGAGRTPLAALEASEVTVPVCVSAVGELRI